MRALAIAPFRRLWLGQATSQVGNRIHQLGVAWWVLKETGSPALMGLMFVAGSLPMVLGGPFGGVLADRFDRRRVMLVCDAASAVLVSLLAVMATKGFLAIPLLLVLQVALATLSALFTPASLAVIPDLVPESALIEANSLQELTTQLAGLAGPALGGILTAVLGPAGAFWVNAGTFVVSSLALASLPAGSPPTASGESFWQSFWGGFQVLRERPAISSLLASFAVANVFLAPVPVLLPLFAKDVFARGAWGLGALEGALGAGMMGAAFWMARVGTVSRPVSLAAGSFAIQGWLMLLMGLVPRFEGYLLGLMGLGAALSALNVVMVSAFQRAIPPEQLGRFMGVLTTVVMGVMPLSFGLVGVMASWIPPTRIFDASGTMLIAVSLLLPLLPGVRGLQAELSAS